MFKKGFFPVKKNFGLLFLKLQNNTEFSKQYEMVCQEFQQLLC